MRVKMRMRFSPGEALIKFTSSAESPSFPFSSFIWHRLSSILSSADGNCYANGAARWPTDDAVHICYIRSCWKRMGSAYFWLFFCWERQCISKWWRIGARFAPWPQTLLTFGMSHFFACLFHWAQAIKVELHDFNEWIKWWMQDFAWNNGAATPLIWFVAQSDLCLHGKNGAHFKWLQH